MAIERTPQGKVVLYRRATGERLERWPVDAKEMLATGEYVVSRTDAGAVQEPADGEATTEPAPYSPTQLGEDPLLIPLPPANDPTAGGVLRTPLGEPVILEPPAV